MGAARDEQTLRASATAIDNKYFLDPPSTGAIGSLLAANQRFVAATPDRQPPAPAPGAAGVRSAEAPRRRRPPHLSADVGRRLRRTRSEAGLPVVGSYQG